MIDDEIHAMLDARAGSPQHRLADVARAVAVAHPRVGARRTLRSLGWLTAGTAILLVVAVILVVLPGRSRQPDKLRSGQPPVDATSTPFANATATPAPVPWGALTWYSADDGRFEQPGRNVFMQGVRNWRGAWIAVGYALDLTNGHVSGLILHSDDGLAWRREPEQADVQFDRILATSGQIFIVGSHRQPDVGDQPGPRRPAIWASSDDREWTEMALPSGIDEQWVLLNVAIGGNGWLIRAGRIGVDEERWVIGDPSRGWNELKLADDAFPNAFVQGVVGTDEGWIAFGLTGADRGSDSSFIFGDPANDRGAIWSSSDGLTWTAARIDDPGTSVTAIYPLAHGWIATGSDRPGCPGCLGQLGRRSRLWRSDDGSAWTPLALATSLSEPLGWGQIASDGQRGLLFDTDGSRRLRVRETQDGIAWSEVAVFVDSSLSLIAQTSGGVIGIGPDGVVSFVDPSSTSLDHFWMVPQVALAGQPGAGAATQSPAPPPENHDVVCPNSEPCGP